MNRKEMFESLLSELATTINKFEMLSQTRRLWTKSEKERKEFTEIVDDLKKIWLKFDEWIDIYQT